ncbi:hypothetical protein FRC02_003724 [Tulasnella sp. 418]|nr:hypothetical protein FRC02_003724 [Tulasnella sp. 418]
MSCVSENITPTIPSDEMPAPFLGTPYKTEEGLFEYPFPTPPLPTPPYQPSSSVSHPIPVPSTSTTSLSSSSSGVSCSASSSPPVGTRPGSPVNNKISSKLFTDGPVPPGLTASVRKR